jgi:UDP-N-acetyl-D-mannosaminuronic acid transferase (WecB/TagA/CpsF family)
MLKRNPESINAQDFIKRLEGVLPEQRARVFVFVTGRHAELACASEPFEFALSQADFLIASDEYPSTHQVLSQDSMLGALATWVSNRAIKVALIAGPERDAEVSSRAIAEKHPALEAIKPISLQRNFDKDEQVTGKVIEEINRLSPDILLVWSSLNAEETWIANYRHRFNCSAVIGLH